MGDTVTKGFLVGVNLFVACAIVSLGLFLMNSGKILSSNFSSKLSNMNSNILNDELLQYEGATVKGADVVNCIKKHSNDFEIVVNKKCGSQGSQVNCSWSTVTNSGTGSLATGSFVNLPSYAKDDMNGDPLADGQIYINPNAKFLGRIDRNANGAISRIVFNQVDYVADATTVPESGNTTIVISNGDNDLSSGMASAIALLNQSARDFSEAITRLTESGTGSDVVQTQMLASLSALTTIVNEMNDQLTDIRNSSGVGDDSLSENVANLQSKLNALYDLIANSSASGDKTDHDADDIYQDVGTANGYLTQINANVETMRTTMVDVQNSLVNINAQLASMSATMSNDHQKIITMLEQISREQQSQSGKLDSISDGIASIHGVVNAQNEMILNQRDQISNLNNTVNDQRNTIASQSSTIASQSSYISDLLNQIAAMQSAKTSSARTDAYNNIITASDSYGIAAQNAQTLSTQCQQVNTTILSVNQSLASLSAWFEEHPGGKV